MAKKVTVTVGGKVFTRRTERPYRWAVIGRMEEAAALEAVTRAYRSWEEKERAAIVESYMTGWRKRGYFGLHVLGWTTIDPTIMAAKFRAAEGWGGYHEVAIVPEGGTFPAKETP